MSWSGVTTYYAEYKGKFYGIESLSQRNKLVKEFGFETVPSHDVYKYRIPYVRIPMDKFDAFIATLKD